MKRYGAPNRETPGRHRSELVAGAASGLSVGPGRHKHVRGASYGAFETDSEAAWGRVPVDQEPAARKRLQAELSDLLATVHDPAIFERRLFTLARRAAVLDGVALVRLAQAYLPKHARILRSAGKRVLRRLHLSAASDSDRAGYPRLAVAHLVRGVLLQPTILFRRRSIGILARCLTRTNSRNRLLQKQAVSVFRLFSEHGVRACVFGSLAISLSAGRFVKHHGDIDLVCRSEADTDRAATLLVDELQYRLVRRYEWIGLTGERCFHIVLNAPSGIGVELSYLPENPSVTEQVVVVDSVPVRAADLRGLRTIYALFLVKKAVMSHDVEKQSKKNAILTIDRLLSAEAAQRRRFEFLDGSMQSTGRSDPKNRARTR